MTTQTQNGEQPPDLLKAKAKYLRAMADKLDGRGASKLDWTDWRTHAVAWAVAVPAMILMSTYVGGVLWVLWGWFIAPLGYPSITLPWAVGLMFTVSLFRKFENPDAVPTYVTAFNLAKPLLVLACGYVVKQFM